MLNIFQFRICMERGPFLVFALLNYFNVFQVCRNFTNLNYFFKIFSNGGAAWMMVTIAVNFFKLFFLQEHLGQW